MRKQRAEHDINRRATEAGLAKRSDPVFQYPAVAAWLRRIEHSGEQPVEGNLPAQTLEINVVPTRLFV